MLLTLNLRLTLFHYLFCVCLLTCFNLFAYYVLLLPHVCLTNETEYLGTFALKT